MAISCNTKFSKLPLEPCNASFHIYGKKLTSSIIKVGEDAYTLETLLHEIAELETVKVLFNLNEKINGTPNPNITINSYSNRIAHFLSPHGENSFMYPHLTNAIEERL
jgi:hypothetical protein